MIISTGMRTDIPAPAFYSQWFLNRIAKESMGKGHDVYLSTGISGTIFTRNSCKCDNYIREMDK